LLPKFLVCQFDRFTRVVDYSRVAEVDGANPPIALDAARGVFNLDRNNLAASLLPESCKGETFKVMLGDAILGHHSTPIKPALVLMALKPYGTVSVPLSANGSRGSPRWHDFS
jgi:hypothetical protein